MLVWLVDPAGALRATIVAEVAKTPEQLLRGLSGRTQVRPGTGMLFDFDYEVDVAFTTKAMLVPIDIAWTDADGFVLAVAYELQPGSLAWISPYSTYRRVLETASGSLRSLGVGRGWSVV